MEPHHKAEKVCLGLVVAYSKIGTEKIYSLIFMRIHTSKLRSVSKICQWKLNL